MQFAKLHRKRVVESGANRENTEFRYLFNSEGVFWDITGFACTFVLTLYSTVTESMSLGSRITLCMYVIMKSSLLRLILKGEAFEMLRIRGVAMWNVCDWIIGQENWKFLGKEVLNLLKKIYLVLVRLALTTSTHGDTICRMHILWGKW